MYLNYLPKVDNITLNKAEDGGWKVCKCGVEKQDKAVQVTAIAIDFRDGGQEGRNGVNHGQYVGFDDAGEILYDVSRM